MGLQHNITDAKDRPRLVDVANKTAKKTLKNKLQTVPMRNHVSFFMKQFNDGISKDLQEIKQALTTKLQDALQPTTDLQRPE